MARINDYLWERKADSTARGLILDVREVRECFQHDGGQWVAVMKTDRGTTKPVGYMLNPDPEKGYEEALEIMLMKSAWEGRLHV